MTRHDEEEAILLIVPAVGAILAWHLAPVMVNNTLILATSPVVDGAPDEL